MKKSDFEGPTWQPSIMEIGAEKIKVDGFTFDKNRLSDQRNAHMLLMLLIAMDPTEKQKEILDKLGVIFTDDNKQQFFPKVDVEKELVKELGKEAAENIDKKFVEDIIKIKEEALEKMKENDKELERIKQEISNNYNPPFLENTNEDK